MTGLAQGARARAVFLSIFTLAAATAAADPVYIELGTLGGSWSDARAISAGGKTVVGSSATNGDATTHAYVWRAATKTMVDIGGGAAGYSWANAVSADGGTVVGVASTKPSQTTNFEKPFVWRVGQMSFLPLLGGATNGTGRAWGVSGDGSSIVGESSTPSGGLHAFLYKGLEMLDLGAGQGSSSSAFGISEDGSTVIGMLGLGTPVAWTIAGGANLYPLPMPAGATGAVPFSVNSNGTLIAGAAQDSNTYRAVVWAKQGGTWTIIADVAKANVAKDPGSLPAALDGVAFYGLAGKSAQWRAVGLGGKTSHAVIGDRDGALAWTDANNIPKLQGKPAGRRLEIANGIARDGTAIAGNSVPVTAGSPVGRRGFYISGLSDITPKGSAGFKPPPFEVTCPAPCFNGPPPDPRQFVTIPEYAWGAVIKERLTKSIEHSQPRTTPR